MLAIGQALKPWQRFLEGAKHPVIIHTDHKNLEYFKRSRIKIRDRPAGPWIYFSLTLRSNTFLAHQTQFLILLVDTQIINTAAKNPQINLEFLTVVLLTSALLYRIHLMRESAKIQEPLRNTIALSKKNSLKTGHLQKDFYCLEIEFGCKASICKEIISCYHDTLAGGQKGTCKTAYHIKTR